MRRPSESLTKFAWVDAADHDAFSTEAAMSINLINLVQLQQNLSMTGLNNGQVGLF